MDTPFHSTALGFLPRSSWRGGSRQEWSEMEWSGMKRNGVECGWFHSITLTLSTTPLSISQHSIPPLNYTPLHSVSSSTALNSTSCSPPNQFTSIPFNCATLYLGLHLLLHSIPLITLHSISLFYSRLSIHTKYVKEWRAL